MRPKLVLDPETPHTFDFGEVVLGRTRAEPVIITVKNKGDGVLRLETVEIQNDATNAFRVSSFPKELPPSGSNEIWVRYEPTQQGNFEATLYIQTNDPERRNVTYSLKGSAREPCSIAVGPSHSRFLLGEIQKISVTANGGTDCVITYLFTDETLFPFMDLPELPFTIPTGTSIDLSIQHVATPAEPGIPIRDVLVKESEGQEVKVSVEGEPPIFGCIDIYPPALYFDQTPIGDIARRSVTVFNRCARPAYVTSALITFGVYFYDVDDELFPLELPPLGSADVEVIYTPFSPAGDDGKLVLNTNDSGARRFEVAMFGQAAVPTAVVFPEVLNFGTVVYKNPRPDMSSECSSGTQVVQIYNQGSTNLTITNLEIAGDTRFQVSGVVADGLPVADFTRPFDIRGGTDAKVSLVFAPSRDMPAGHEGMLLIHHNDSENSPSEVVLRGFGAPVGDAQDQFTQLAGPKADILWVIDNSCSMFDEQARLIQNLQQFISYADSLNADYQMAVVDTDGTSPNSGIFQQCFPHPRVISNTYSDQTTREQAFECLFSLGVSGSGVEAGLAAAKNALVRATSPDQDPVRNRNAGFIREDAKLVVVTMSDEEDQSNEADDLLRDYFFSVHPNRRDLVRVNAIAGPVDEPCPTGEQAAMPGYRYFNMTEETGGRFYNICLEDWQPLLTSLGIDTFTPLSEFTLSQSADPATLVVTVDGVPVPRNASTGYTYNAAANTVKFNGASVPAPGASITVDYEGLCRP